MLLLKVQAENPNSPYSVAYVRFYQDKKTWILQGTFDGCLKNKFYLELPINSIIEKVFDGEGVGDIFTEHEKIDEKQMRLIWKLLVDNGFRLVCEPEEAIDNQIAQL
jgi:hypothetical protein